MKFVRNFWREILCTLSFSVFLYFTVTTINNPPKTSFGRFIIVVFAFAAFAACTWLLRELWRIKWKKHFTRVAQNIIEKISAFFIRFTEKILQKYNIGGKRRKNILSGNTKVTFDSDIFESKISTRAKRIKWKNMQSDRERLGFLYRQMINKKIQTGIRIYACDTPSELLARTQNDEIEKEIFGLYISTRYDERTPLSTDQIADLKEHLETK